MDTLLLNKDHIATIVQQVGLNQIMDDITRELCHAFAAYDEAVVDIQTRDGFIYTDPAPSLLEWMPAAIKGETAVVKMVGYNPANPLRKELPTIVSTLHMYDLNTGHLAALCDGTLLTAIRTGAASALASRFLAQPDSHVVGLIGCGAQSVTQLHALSRHFEIERVLAYDVEPAASSSFAHRVAFLGLDVSVVDRATLEADAHIICTATSVAPGEGPVLNHERLHPAVHINAVGADMPGKTEMPLALLKSAHVCPDYLPQAVLEGECQRLAAEQIGPSLIDLAKTPNAYASLRNEQTVFDSTGFALEDMVAMRQMLDYAKELGLGQSVAVESMAYDALNPYSFVQDAVSSKQSAVKS